MKNIRSRIFQICSTATVALVLCGIFNLQAFWKATIDDTYIAARYSENLANGYGITFTPGFTPVEGYSDPLWVLFLAGVSRLFGPMAIIIAAKTMSLICLASIGVLFVRVASRASFAGGAATAIVAASCFALPGISLWSTAGLETMAYSLAIFVAIVCSVSATYEKRIFPWSAVAIGFACLLRPEGSMFIFAPIVTTAFWGWKADRRKAILRIVTDCATVGIAQGALLLFRYRYFDAITPNTFLVKAGGSVHQVFKGVHYLLQSLEDPLLLALFVLAAYGVKTQWRKNPLVLCSLMVVLLQLAFVLWAGGDWMPLYRFLIPVVLALLFPAVFAMRDLEAWASIDKSRFAALCGLLLVIVCWHIGYDAYAKRSYALRLTEGRNTRIALGMWMHRHLDNTTTVAYGDAGALPFFSHLHWIDFHGLVTRQVAMILFANQGNAQCADDAIASYVLSEHPDLIILVTALPDLGSKPIEYGFKMEQEPTFVHDFRYVAALTVYKPGMALGYPTGRYLQVFATGKSPQLRETLRREITCLNTAFVVDPRVDFLVDACDEK